MCGKDVWEPKADERVGGSASEHKGGGRVKEGRRSEASVDLLERTRGQSVDQAEHGTAFTLFPFV